MGTGTSSRGWYGLHSGWCGCALLLSHVVLLAHGLPLLHLVGRKHACQLFVGAAVQVMHLLLALVWRQGRVLLECIT